MRSDFSLNNNIPTINHFDIFYDLAIKNNLVFLCIKSRSLCLSNNFLPYLVYAFVSNPSSQWNKVFF